MMMSQVQLPLHMEDCLLSNYTLSYGGREKVLQLWLFDFQIFKNCDFVRKREKK